MRDCLIMKAKTLCQYDNGKCSQCGEAMRPDWFRGCPMGPNPPRPIEKSPPCPHLGEPTDSFALLQCKTCCGNVRHKHEIHVCAIFGKCLPRFNETMLAAATKAEGCHGCLGCEYA